MSADFWAGYFSGAAGILVGNPLDVAKVRLQARCAALGLDHVRALATGTAAPVLGYGVLNALLFVSYRRSEAALDRALSTDPAAPPGRRSLWATWLAGALGGLCTWVVSAPTELVKCRAQVSALPSWTVARHIWCSHGLRALYFGGSVTALRDSIGYGFYFWSYELATTRCWPYLPLPLSLSSSEPAATAARVLLCGGVAGVVSWTSIFPLDVVKTRVQAQPWHPAPLVPRPAGALQVARNAFREGGMPVFFRGLVVCSVRAFIVNAVQWAVYESLMRHMVHVQGT